MKFKIDYQAEFARKGELQFPKGKPLISKGNPEFLQGILQCLKEIH